MNVFRLSPVVLCVLLIGPRQELLSCTSCMGGSSGPIGEAANGAIFLMLGVLGVVLGLIVAAGYSLVRRSQVPIPHEELVRSISDSHLNEV